MFLFPRKWIIQGHMGEIEFQEMVIYFAHFLFSSTVVKGLFLCTWNNGLPMTSLSPTSLY